MGKQQQMKSFSCRGRSKWSGLEAGMNLAHRKKQKVANMAGSHGQGWGVG